MSNITCSKCTAVWTGEGRCHCSKCHNTFGGLTSFDQHRKGYRCLQPSKLDLTLNARGVWVSAYAGPEGSDG